MIFYKIDSRYRLIFRLFIGCCLVKPWFFKEVLGSFWFYFGIAFKKREQFTYMGKRMILTLKFLSATLEARRCWKIFKEYQQKKKNCASFGFPTKDFKNSKSMHASTFYRRLEEICLLN